jgi:PPM family protein phosphatase
MKLVKMRIYSYGKSDIGLLRSNNEDAWAQIPSCHFYVLADGMGGHPFGEVAASLAISLLCHGMATSTPPTCLEDATLLLKRNILRTNRSLFSLSAKEKKLQGMGTTLCCLFLYQQYFILANIGDSRVYYWRQGDLTQLSLDHSCYAEGITRSKKMITKSVGLMRDIHPHTKILEIQEGDIFFLCSDGLTDYVLNEEIEKILKSSFSLEQATTRMIDQAKEKGGSDNITVLMIQVSKNEEKNLSR